MYNFLGTKVNLGDKVKFFVKPPKILKSEGWSENEKGQLIKPEAYYKFTKGKLELTGQTIKGSIGLNPKGKVSVFDSKMGWGFDESMVSFIVPIDRKYKSFDEIIDHVTFKGDSEGNIRIGQYGFTKKSMRNILLLLFKYDRWIVDE